MIALKGSINTIREVEVSLEKVVHKDVNDILEVIYSHGQNDLQPKKIRSVSIGDVIELVTPKSEYKGVYYAVAANGFIKIESPEYAPNEFDLMFGDPQKQVDRNDKINKVVE